MGFHHSPYLGGQWQGGGGQGPAQTMPREDGLGVASCIAMAIDDAGIDREQVRHPPVFLPHRTPDL